MTYTIKRVDDERGYHYFEVVARQGKSSEVVAVCDDQQEARDIVRAIETNPRSVETR